MHIARDSCARLCYTRLLWLRDSLEVAAWMTSEREAWSSRVTPYVKYQELVQKKHTLPMRWRMIFLRRRMVESPISTQHHWVKRGLIMTESSRRRWRRPESWSSRCHRLASMDPGCWLKKGAWVSHCESSIDATNSTSKQAFDEVSKLHGTDM